MRVRAFVLLLIAAAPLQAQALLDPGFAGGRVSLFFDQANTTKRDEGRHVFLDDQGKLTVVGTADVDDPNPSVVGIALARLHPDGQLDTSFGGPNLGRRVKNAALDSVEDAAFEGYSDFSDLLVVGRFGNDSALVRFRNGLDDTSLAGDGGIVWDASGSGAVDVPQAVAILSTDYAVGGRYDSDPGAGVDYDIFLGSVDSSSGALNVYLREELGGAGAALDRVVDIEAPEGSLLIDADGPLLLADNPTPGYAGTLMQFRDDGSREQSFRLENLLDEGAGCNEAFTDAESVDLVVIDFRRIAVVGNLLDSFGAPVHGYVIVVDVYDGQVDSVRCSPALAAGTVYLTAGARIGYSETNPDLHFAVNINGKAGYWRWAPFYDGESHYNYLPDPAFNSGAPLTVNYQASVGPSLGFTGGVAVDDEGRAVVVGTHTVHAYQGDGLDDHDVAVFRVHAGEWIHGDGFETVDP